MKMAEHRREHENNWWGAAGFRFQQLLCVIQIGGIGRYINASLIRGIEVSVGRWASRHIHHPCRLSWRQIGPIDGAGGIGSIWLERLAGRGGERLKGRAGQAADAHCLCQRVSVAAFAHNALSQTNNGQHTLSQPPCPNSSDHRRPAWALYTRRLLHGIPALAREHPHRGVVGRLRWQQRLPSVQPGACLPSGLLRGPRRGRRQDHAARLQDGAQRRFFAPHSTAGMSRSPTGIRGQPRM